MTRDCFGAPAPTAPRFVVPRGACDCHLHVLGPYDRYPLAAERGYTAPLATTADLEAFLDRMGLDRVVIAHVSAHGADHRVTLDAMAALGDRARGTMMLADERFAALEALHRRGMRGVRLSGNFGLPVSIDVLRATADRIGPLGWHVAIWPADLAELDAIAAALPDLGVPVVIDHLGARAWDNGAGGLDHPGFRLLRELLASGRVWLKLSAPYRAAPEADHPWPTLVPFARALAVAAPERMLWASDWPHVGLFDRPPPLSGHLLDWLADVAPDAAARDRILVDNPAALYGFP
ncbi:MAG TPA: amidohydrolase family protein [Hyphomicrobiales bacterium]|nr:amidohydrolase family protein [Hyphomicrobiales bacterium]